MVDLRSIRSLEAFTELAQKTKPNRDQWILGFGWDDTLWSQNQGATLELLDQLFPEKPIALSRSDGHALAVNSQALRCARIDSKELTRLKFIGGRVGLDRKGAFNGILVDAARDSIEKSIPSVTDQEVRENLLLGMKTFNEAGFTHIRDVGGCYQHYLIASEIEKAGGLRLFCEMYFNLDSFKDLSDRIVEIKTVQKREGEQKSQIRVSGLKVFYDGALGSEGALLSQPYPSGQQGVRLLTLDQVEVIFQSCWQDHIPVAIHVLGDQAVSEVLSVALKLKEKGVEGVLHLEHCQVVRPDSIEQMKMLNIRCHMQPSHYLSDRKWLKEKLGSLYKFCFPWRSLLEGGIPISFGSDSPIENPSLKSTQEALEQASHEGIGFLPISPWLFHSHPNGQWGRNCYTQLKEDGSVKVFFNLN